MALDTIRGIEVSRTVRFSLRFFRLSAAAAKTKNKKNETWKYAKRCCCERLDACGHVTVRNCSPKDLLKKRKKGRSVFASNVPAIHRKWKIINFRKWEQIHLVLFVRSLVLCKMVAGGRVAHCKNCSQQWTGRTQPGFGRRQCDVDQFMCAKKLKFCRHTVRIVWVVSAASTMSNPNHCRAEHSNYVVAHTHRRRGRISSRFVTLTECVQMLNMLQYMACRPFSHVSVGGTELDICQEMACSSNGSKSGARAAQAAVVIVVGHRSGVWVHYVHEHVHERAALVWLMAHGSCKMVKLAGCWCRFFFLFPHHTPAVSVSSLATPFEPSAAPAPNMYIQMVNVCVCIAARVAVHRLSHTTNTSAQNLSTRKWKTAIVFVRERIATRCRFWFSFRRCHRNVATRRHNAWHHTGISSRRHLHILCIFRLRAKTKCNRVERAAKRCFTQIVNSAEWFESRNASRWLWRATGREKKKEFFLKTKNWDFGDRKKAPTNLFDAHQRKRMLCASLRKYCPIEIMRTEHTLPLCLSNGFSSRYFFLFFRCLLAGSTRCGCIG